METTQTIGGRIKFLRKRKGMTQGQFAANMGITQGNLSLIENNLISASTDILLKTSDFFKISCEWLIRGDEYFRKRIVDQDFVPVMTSDGSISENRDFSAENFLKSNQLYRIPGFEESGQLLFRMNRENMTPSFSPGDVLIGLAVENPETLQDDTAVIVKLNDEMLVKRISISKKGDILLTNDNTRYKDLTLKKSHLKSMWKVQGVVKRIREDLSNVNINRIDELETTLKLMQEQLDKISTGISKSKVL